MFSSVESMEHQKWVICPTSGWSFRRVKNGRSKYGVSWRLINHVSNLDVVLLSGINIREVEKCLSFHFQSVRVNTLWYLVSHHIYAPFFLLNYESMFGLQVETRNNQKCWHSDTGLEKGLCFLGARFSKSISANEHLSMGLLRSAKVASARLVLVRSSIENFCPSLFLIHKH